MPSVASGCSRGIIRILDFHITSTYQTVSAIPGSKMKKSTYTCGLEAALTVVGGKWKFLVLWNLASGTKRLGELRRLVAGVSEKMLIQELKEMVDDGIVIRRDYQEVPPKVEYSLTELGLSLATACRPLC